MKYCISRIISWMIHLWRTIVSTLCRKHIYKKDVDNDDVEEIVIDLNGNQDSSNQQNIILEEDYYDK